jgi:hypothetical protein
MAYDMDRVTKAQAKLESLLAPVFRDAAIGCGVDEAGGERLEVMLRRQPTAAQKKQMPQDVDGVKVRYTVTGPIRAF